MNAQERKDCALKLAKARNHAEALPLLKAAVLDYPNDENLWQELVLNSARTEGSTEASEWAKEALHRHPRSGWL